jgi:hypothetical protein
MIDLPPSKYLRRGVVRQYLGIDERDFSKLVRTGVLRPCYFQGRGRAWFVRDEVLHAEQTNRIFRPAHTTQPKTQP